MGLHIVRVLFRVQSSLHLSSTGPQRRYRCVSARLRRVLDILYRAGDSDGEVVKMRIFGSLRTRTELPRCAAKHSDEDPVHAKAT